MLVAASLFFADWYRWGVPDHRGLLERNLPEIQSNGVHKWCAGVGPFFTNSYDGSVGELSGWIALNPGLFSQTSPASES
jgi:hypothetical protein